MKFVGLDITGREIWSRWFDTLSYDPVALSEDGAWWSIRFDEYSKDYKELSILRQKALEAATIKQVFNATWVNVDEDGLLLKPFLPLIFDDFEGKYLEVTLKVVKDPFEVEE